MLQVPERKESRTSAVAELAGSTLIKNTPNELSLVQFNIYDIYTRVLQKNVRSLDMRAAR